MSPKPRSAIKRLVPVAKIAVAAGLIAFLLWLVPIRDQLHLPQRDPAPIPGEIVAETGDRIRFETTDGGILELTLAADAETIEAARFPDGEVHVPPPRAPEEPQPRLERGLLTVLSTASVPHLLIALGLLFAGSLVAVYRWYLLLLGAGLDTPLPRAFSLTFIGAFFNNIMPGLTGGDIVKAVYIAREHRNRKTEAIITVLLDRVLGISGLALVAGIVIPFNYAEYAIVAPWIYGLLLAMAGFTCVFFSRRVRRALRIDALLARLPFQEVVSKIDRAVFIYRFRRRVVLVSLLLSMVVHLIIIAGIATIGIGIGLRLEFLSYFAVVPIGLIVMALPIAPSGWGVGEAAFVYFFGTLGVSASRALSLSLLYRIEQLAISLIGGVCLAVQKQKVSSAEMEQFAEGEPPPAAA